MSGFGGPGPGPSNNWRSGPRNQGGFNRRRGRGRGGSQHTLNNESEEHMNRKDNNVIFNKSNKKNNQNLGMLTLIKLSKCEGNEILAEINAKKEAFNNIIQKPPDRLDVYSLILLISAKVSQSRLEQLKLELLLEICNSGFMQNLVLYLLNLPYSDNKKQNSLYWEDQTAFWKNLLLTLECIIVISPSTAVNKCRPLIESASKCCLDALKEKHNYELPEEYAKKFQMLREFLTNREKTKEEEKKTHSEPPIIAFDEPPNSFRELSVLPTTDDLLDSQPYIRPNIVDGAYASIDHYLDVQFRLLREDCYGPIREGIMQFRHDPTRKRYENIRVFRKVKFVEPYVSSIAFGHTIQLDPQTTKRFRNIRWKFNKRFLYGALLLFTKDDCKSFTVATVLDRESSYLCNGKIPVSIMDNCAIPNNKDEYIMIESDIYFEPYYHVLKVLKDPTFPEDLAMKKYIVDVEASSSPPLYLREFTPDIHRKFLSSAEEMCLNESQYEAFKLALTHEFAVIQGPPGTGKTYLGVKVAERILKLKQTEKNCFLLIICYTNHALDQFLDAILRITTSIVRIGGQSRMESMKKLNLNEIRKQASKCPEWDLYYDKKKILKTSVSKLNHLQNIISAIDNGILNIKVLKEQNNIRNIRSTVDKIETHYETLCNWLFDSNLIKYDYSQSITADDAILESLTKKVSDDDGDINVRDVCDIFEDLNIDNENLDNICEFSLNTARKDLIKMIKKYKSNPTDNVRMDIIQYQVWIETFEDMKHTFYQDEVQNVDVQHVNPLRMSLHNRWMLYFQWASNIKRNWLQNIKPIQDEAIAASAAYEESRIILDIRLLKRYKVIGMTTSGAARMRKLIREVAPQIVIVEEAAEVLEQHIVTSLQQNCQHVILIGDHKQLRPSASHMKLARHYNIEVSLFERMIKNKIHSRCLSVQHRMRPEIAALISPHIYPDLKNHSSVECFPNVRGLAHNLFFFTHEHPEQNSEDSTSKFNENEANIILGLANYIMQQGYEPEDVTILAAYTAQMFYMTKKRDNYAFLSKVKITVVDNYQGEESKIILLSLVRNNADNKIGFLGTENRICVALSRAREGLYIFGNMSMLKNQSELWKKINGTLGNACAIGTTLELRCQSHPDYITQIDSPTDFEKVPEGGCMLKCDSKLSCSHACPLICHAYDRNHDEIRCIEKCERILCDLQHVCPLWCAQECTPCKVEVEKTLPCGHINKVPCHIDPNTDKVLCHKIVTVTLPSCGHEAKKICYMDIGFVACPVECSARLECGHACARTCHVNSDPEHEMYSCEKPCVKHKKDCSFTSEEDKEDHMCKRKCYEKCDVCKVEVMKKRQNCKHSQKVPCHVDVNTILCRKNCARLLPCNHHCKKKCHEPCGDCEQLVLKKIPECGHKVKVPCKMTVDASMCKAQCQRVMSCGHPCQRLCCEPCDEENCNFLREDQTYDSPCGHKIALPCNISQRIRCGENVESRVFMECCKVACEAQLECGHACAGSCAACWQGRLHAPCRQRCDKPSICGHVCKEPCNEICPPCEKPCEVQCKHSKCKNKCGMPCTPCKEKCDRKCEHGQCTKLCGEVCSIPPCSEPCPKLMKCGHPCRGLCGNPCPNVCKICKPDSFPRDLTGFEYEDDVRFIVLEDCLHIMDVDELDVWMNSKMETIGIKTCPFCRIPIIKTFRYKDHINNTLKNEIEPIKQKTYGNPNEIKAKKVELFEKISTFCLDHPDIMKEMYVEYKKNHLSILKSYLNRQIDMMCDVLIKNVKKFSYQLQNDIKNEMKRVHAIIQFDKIIDNPEFKIVKNNNDVKIKYEEAFKLILGCKIYTEQQTMEALDSLQKVVKINVVSDKKEIELVVKAVGLKAGHWFKCPNGHFYCIGECGGAMQVSKCPECGEAIGGSSHRLLATNSHARELDGSQFPAWSEQYNNMANFML
ncbi:unnamed protein product [Colias eurytheme]|nr:unnamed protein product [Colias eurytheme]